jgi:hypothetical protein
MRFWRIASGIVLFWFLALAALHFANPRPLWNDEAAVFSSLETFSASRLFTSELLASQVFPRVYLWTIQQFSSSWGHALWSLRFFPFISMIMAFLIWAWLAKKILVSPRLWTLFLLSWTGSTILVYYASELKQYSLDVLAAAVWILFILEQGRIKEALKNHYLLLLGLLPLTALFSHRVLFFLIFPFWQIMASNKENRSKEVIVYTAAALVSMALLYHFDLRLSLHSRQDILNGAYNDYFISFASPGEFLQTFTEGLNNLIGRWFASKPVWVRGFCRIFMLVGMAELFLGIKDAWKGRSFKTLSIHIMAGVVFLELILAGMFKFNYFSIPRTSLFFCPVLFLLTVLGFKRIELRLPRWGKIIQILYGMIVLFFSIIVTKMALFRAVGEDMSRWMRF